MACTSGPPMNSTQQNDLHSSQPQSQSQHQHTRSNSSNVSSLGPSSPNLALKPTPRQAGTKSPLSHASPQTSRETSPLRQFLTPQSTLHSQDNASKSRAPALSPSRSPTFVSAVPENNALRGGIVTSSRPGSTNINGAPKPGTINEAINRLWQTQKQDNKEAPRLKSPTPSVKSRHNSTGSMTKPNAEILEHNPVVERLGLEPGEVITKAPSTSSNISNTGVKIPRGYSGRMLETVEEGDQPLSPEDTRTLSSTASSILEEPAILPKSHSINDSGNFDISDAISLTSQDGGDQTERADFATRASTIVKSDARRDSSSTVRKAYSALIPTKVRSNDPSAKIMTVETETVASIPTTIIASAADRSGGRGESGTLRKMASVETIKPRKKKVPKKTPSIISGMTSSKADIFEAKVASAVDEDESDSDETFVYESNPPEPRHRQHRHHSRTPSNTSTSSFRDRRSSARPVGNLLDNHRKLRGKRSMKFASNSYAGSPREESGEEDQGTVRASASRRRDNGGSTFLASDLYAHTSGDNEPPTLNNSPYSLASKTRPLYGLNSRTSSKNDSQLGQAPMYVKSPTRKSTSSPYGYTLEDERSPLVGSIRGQQRLRPYRRQQGSGSGGGNMRHLDYYIEEREDRSLFSLSSGCMMMTLIILLVVGGACAFLFATSKPLYDVKVQQIENVIASEQEIMLDLLVEAFNPNIVSIVVDEMDVNVFARSRYLKDDVTDMILPTTTIHTRRLRNTVSGGTHDHGTDPMPSDPTIPDPQTMLLGRVFDFDTALLFDGSPIRRLAHNSTGEFRLPWPGNKTEVGGHERWERVIKHEFELIVRGILKYQLPMSSRTMTVGISANVTVKGSSGEVGKVEEEVD